MQLCFFSLYLSTSDDEESRQSCVFLAPGGLCGADPLCVCPPQAKFSELTIDMFRMLQTLEREPQEEGLHSSCETSPNSARTPYVSGGHRAARVLLPLSLSTSPVSTAGRTLAV